MMNGYSYESLLALMITTAAGIGLPSSGATATENAVTNLTLEAALQIALLDNPKLRAAASRVDAAAGRAWQLGRWSNPELEFEVEEWPVSRGGTFSDAKQTVGVRQQLPWPVKKKYEREMGRAGIRLSKSELALRKTEVVRDVTASFHRVLAAEASVEVGEALLRIAQSFAETAKKRVASGAAPYQEQLRADIQLEQAQSEVADLRLEASAAKEWLLALVGRDDLASAAVAGTLADACDRTLLAATPKQWQGKHPSYMSASANLRLAELEVKRTRLEPYPDLAASVAGGRLGETDESIVEFGFSIPVPLFDSSKGRKAEARARVSVARAELDAIRLALHREWTQAARRYRTAGQQVASYRDDLLPKAGEALRLVQLGFEEGKFSFIDLLDTQRTFVESQLAYQRKLLELNIAQAELEALVNPCIVTDLSQNNH